MTVTLTPEDTEDDKINDAYQSVFGVEQQGDCETAIRRYESEVIPLAQKSKFDVPKNKFLFLANRGIGNCYIAQRRYDGVLHKAIFVEDDEAKDNGFVVSYFPRSALVHRALGNTTSDFYKRHGDSFTPLSTEEIKALFFRSLAPELELIVEKRLASNAQHYSIYHYTFGIKNSGPGVARFVSLYVGFADLPNVTGLQYWDGEGNNRYPLGSLLEAPDFFYRGKHFIVNGDILIYPDQLLRLFLATFTMSGENSPPAAKFKIFAEGMLPREGEAAG